MLYARAEVATATPSRYIRQLVSHLSHKVTTEQLSDKTGVTPERAREAVTKGTSAAAQRRVPLAAAVVASVAGFVLVRWWRKR